MMKKLILNLLFLMPISMFAKGFVEISGKVMDIHTNSPLFECHVYLTENYGVLTDEDGFFTLKVPASYGDELLHISYVGYETYFKPLKEIMDDNIVVGLIQEIPMLDEIIVYANPWNEFSEVVIDLSSKYESKDEFYAVLFEELHKIELELNGNSNDVMVAGSWSVLIIMIIIILTGVFMMRPIIARFSNINRFQQV